MRIERFREILIKEFGFSDDPNFYSVLGAEEDSNYVLNINGVFLIGFSYADGISRWSFSEDNPEEIQGAIYWDESLQKLKPIIKNTIDKNREFLIETGLLSNQFNNEFLISLEQFINILSERFGFTTDPEFYAEVNDQKENYVEYSLIGKNLFTIQYIIDGDKVGTWYFTNYKAENLQGANYWSTDFLGVSYYISNFLKDNKNLLIEEEILTVQLTLKGFTKKQALLFCEWFGEAGEQDLLDWGYNQEPVIETPLVDIHSNRGYILDKSKIPGYDSIYLHCKTVYSNN